MSLKTKYKGHMQSYDRILKRFTMKLSEINKQDNRNFTHMKRFVKINNFMNQTF